ncbi:MAG: tetraacyldisaccharide 4'-kinase [Fimbriimonadaceae bacterium]|jgi:tetraacyldisaccharide 4'-kinase|nr:tetraacyldisaccharide 4'-kinase [Fimbriimonadaceae bacterium]
MAWRIEDSWEANGPIPLALWPLSLLYGGGWLAYQAIYDLGLKRAKRPHPRTVCVGNLVVGGVGKTPFTFHLTQLIRSFGYPVIVSTSGYGSCARRGATLVPPGDIDPAEYGDETAWYRWRNPELTLIAGKDRVRAAEIAAELGPDTVFVMDDGFQHLPLAPHISLVLDPDRKNRFCLPAGPYREPRRTGRKRSKVTLPGVFAWTSHQLPLSTPSGETVKTPSEVQLLCALGQPLKVKAALESMGATVSHYTFLPDHDPLVTGNLWESLNTQFPIVVTAKDWMKIRNRSDWLDKNLLIADYEVLVTPEREFSDWLKGELSGL